MHLLRVYEEGLADRIIKLFPQSVDVVADIAGAHGLWSATR